MLLPSGSAATASATDDRIQKKTTRIKFAKWDSQKMNTNVYWITFSDEVSDINTKTELEHSITLFRGV